MDDVKDALAAVLISVHSAGTHTNLCTNLWNNSQGREGPAPKGIHHRIEQRMVLLLYWHDYIEATKVAGKYSYSNVATNNYAKT